jgi:hypothetical protein
MYVHTPPSDPVAKAKSRNTAPTALRTSQLWLRAVFRAAACGALPLTAQCGCHGFSELVQGEGAAQCCAALQLGEPRAIPDMGVHDLPDRMELFHHPGSLPSRSSASPTIRSIRTRLAKTRASTGLLLMRTRSPDWRSVWSISSCAAAFSSKTTIVAGFLRMRDTTLPLRAGKG